MLVDEIYLENILLSLRPFISPQFMKDHGMVNGGIPKNGESVKHTNVIVFHHRHRRHPGHNNDAKEERDNPNCYLFKIILAEDGFCQLNEKLWNNNVN